MRASGSGQRGRPSTIANLLSRLGCGRQSAAHTALNSEHPLPYFQYRAWVVKNDVNSKKEGAIVLLDTGARANLISRAMVQRLGMEPRPIEPRKLFPISSESTKLEITADCHVLVEWNFENGPKTYTSECLVLDMSYDIVMGADEIKAKKLMEREENSPGQRGIARWVDGKPQSSLAKKTTRLICRVHDRVVSFYHSTFSGRRTS